MRNVPPNSDTFGNVSVPEPSFTHSPVPLSETDGKVPDDGTSSAISAPSASATVPTDAPDGTTPHFCMSHWATCIRSVCVSTFVNTISSLKKSPPVRFWYLPFV